MLRNLELDGLLQLNSEHMILVMISREAYTKAHSLQNIDVLNLARNRMNRTLDAGASCGNGALTSIGAVTSIGADLTVPTYLHALMLLRAI